MLISCEKCSTTYDLDETLLPVAGAPVQCTRCQHVFTAYPPRDVAASASEPEEEPTASRKRAAVVPPGIPQGRPANQTMVFGTAAATQQQAPSSGPAPRANPNQTMMFGGAQAAAPAPTAAPPAAPPARPASQTMVFGTSAGQQLAAAPAAPVAPANQTLVFGGGAPAAPAPAVNQTMVFGTPAGQQLAQAPVPPPAAPSANQTLVFGGAPVAPAPASQTMVFGTAAGQQLATNPAAASAPANQTLVFGAQAPVAAASPKSTQMFGAPQTTPQASPKSTQVFGAPADPNALKAAGSSTMMFGKPPEAAAPARTMAFGAPAVTAPKKPPQLTAAEPTEAEPEFQRSESTVRVDLERMMREHEEPAAEPARHDRTQRFAMTSGTTPSEGNESVQDRHNRTALFAMSTLQETTKPDGKAPASTSPELVGVSEATVGIDAMATLPPDNATLPASLRADQFGFGPSSDDPPGHSTMIESQGIASTLPNLPPIAQGNHDPLRLDLLSSDQGLPTVGGGTLPDNAAQDDIEAFAAQGRRRNIVAIVIVLAIVVLAALGVAWQLFGKQLLSRNVDPRLKEAVAQSLEKLRREDREQRTAEIKRLEELVRENPTSVDAHAALVLACALEFDDVQGKLSVLRHRYNQVFAEHTPLPDGPRKAELARRIRDLIAQEKALTEPHAETQEHLRKADGALLALQESTPAVTRARGFAKAVTGGQAPSGEATDYWVRLGGAAHALLVAEHATDPKAEVALEEAKNQLRAELDALSSVNELNELARTHFVMGRLHLALGEEKRAVEALAKAVALAPKFEAAAASAKVLSEP